MALVQEQLLALATETLDSMSASAKFCLALAASFGLVIAFYFVLFLARVWSLRGIPGPLPLPFVGHLYLPGAPAVLSYLSKNRKKYGRVFQFWPGNAPLLVIAEPVAARQILTDSRKFIKGPDYTEKFSVCFGEGLVTSRDPKHKRDRACLGKYFTRDAVAKHQRMIGDLVTARMDDMLEQEAGKGGDGVDIQHFFHTLTLQMFGKFAVSHDYKTDPYAEELNSIVSWGSNVIGEHIMLGIPVWSWLPRMREMHRRLKHFFAHNDALVDARVAKREAAKAAGDEHGGKGGPDGEGDVLDAMIDAQLPRQEIRFQLVTLLAAGHDTTAFFGCYMVHMMAQHPEVQAKAKAEIRAVLAASRGSLAAADAPDAEPATSDELGQMKYIRMIMQETLRMYSVIPLVTRMADDDVEVNIGGEPPRAGGAADKAAAPSKPAAAARKITVRKGQQVLVPLAVLSRDDAVWDNPQQFRPERFDGMCDTTSGYSSAKHGYLPFGYGSRACIGNTLAMSEGAAMVVGLMRRYTFEPVPGFKPQIIGGISLVPQNGIRVRLSRDDA